MKTNSFDEYVFNRGIDQFQLTLNFFLRHEILTPEAIKLFSDSQLYQLFKTYFSCPTDDETLTLFMDGYFYAFARWLDEVRGNVKH